MGLDEIDKNATSGSTSRSNLDKAVSSRVSAGAFGSVNMPTPKKVGDKSTEISYSHGTSAGSEASVNANWSDVHSSTLMQRLMETQDKLLRAQIRLQVYQKLKVTCISTW